MSSAPDDREAQRPRRRAPAGVGGGDRHRVAARPERLGARQAPSEANLVCAAVARDRQRPDGDLAPAHLPHEGEAHARVLVEDEGERRPAPQAPTSMRLSHARPWAARSQPERRRVLLPTGSSAEPEGDAVLVGTGVSAGGLMGGPVPTTSVSPWTATETP